MTKVFKPIRENIIVEVFCQEEVSKGGIILQTATASHDMKREEGIILEIGEHAFYDTNGSTVKVGDRVGFAKYAGKILDVLPNKNQIRVMKDIDLLCRIEEIAETEVVTNE